MKKKRGTVTAGGYLGRLMLRAWGSLTGLFKKDEGITVADWVGICEFLIGKHSTAAATSGPEKGHSRTDSVKWICDLVSMVQHYLAMKNRGRIYDGNMALASRVGLILVAWYCHVHRAKSYDSNRPLSDRQGINRQRSLYLAELMAVINDDSIMGQVWGKGQEWNFPFGKGAKGGKFQ